MSQNRAWEEQITIPTYPVGVPDKNPMFLEKRMYQGSTGVVCQFPAVHRNLGLAYFTCLNLPDSALLAYETASALDDTDARVLYELDQLRKRLNYPADRRLAALEAYPNLIGQRDDLYVEWVTLQNLCGQPSRALSSLAARQFHSWEGEGKVSGQYVQATTALARPSLETEAYFEAIEYLKRTMNYPENIGEGKLFGARENDIIRWLGEAYQGVGNTDQANACWGMASTGSAEPAPAIFCNDQRPEAIFYQGLGYLGLEQFTATMEQFDHVLQVDQSPQGAVVHKTLLQTL